MIGYVTVGTNDIVKAGEFYDELFSSIGGKRFLNSEGFIAWAKVPGQAGFSVTVPSNGEPATTGNGAMVSLECASHAEVDMLYKKAIALGAICAGEPGQRGGQASYYAGYFRDLDGNKINGFYFDVSQIKP